VGCLNNSPRGASFCFVLPAKVKEQWMTSADAPTVFVIDDDAAMRAAIQGLLKSVGLRSETFGIAHEFLHRKRPDGPSCLVLDVKPSWSQWHRISWLAPSSEYLHDR